MSKDCQGKISKLRREMEPTIMRSLNIEGDFSLTERTLKTLQSQADALIRAMNATQSEFDAADKAVKKKTNELKYLLKKLLSTAWNRIKALFEDMRKRYLAQVVAIAALFGGKTITTSDGVTVTNVDDNSEWKPETDEERLAWEKAKLAELKRWREKNDPVDSSVLERTFNEEAEYTAYIDITGNANELCIDKVFLRRLAAWVRDYGPKDTDGNPIKLKITSDGGYRTNQKQTELYNDWINRKPGASYAGPPGSSKHEYGVALDIAGTGNKGGNECGDWFRRFAWGTDKDHKGINISEEALLEEERILKEEYGLCKPITNPPNTNEEGWHVQPIETKGKETNELSHFRPKGCNI